MIVAGGVTRQPQLPWLLSDSAPVFYSMSKRILILLFFLLLLVLHQDFWWRSDATLVLGIFPVSLAYHIGWTLLVAVGWFMVTKFCWPHALDEEVSKGANPERKPQPHSSSR